jgi:hypothetical protein
MSTIVCPSCNTPAPAGSVFCDNCGYDLRNVAAAPAVSAQTVLASPPGGGFNCPQCGQPNVPGASFCENCGAQLGQPAPVQQPPYQAPVQQPPYQAPVQQPPYQAPVQQPPYQAPVQQPPYQAPVQQPPYQAPYQPPMQQSMGGTGRLVVQGTNASIPIPAGKPTMIIGREDPVSSIFPDIDLDPYGGHDAGVGRQHAKLLAQGGQILLEDNNSVNGTWVNRQKLPPNQPRPLNNGDELRLGKLILNYYTS